jgi:hypothetical protein
LTIVESLGLRSAVRTSQTRLLGSAALCLVFVLASCAQVETGSTTRLDGQPCRTTKVRPDFYSAEVWTDCLDKDGHAVTVATNHTDLGQWGFFISALIAATAMR